MAELNVEPKKKSSSLVWIIVIIIIILLILFFVFRGNNNKNGNNAVNDNDTTTSMNATSKTDTSANTSNTSSNTLAATEGWQGIDYNAPKATYPELNDKNVEVRDNDKYAIYSLGQSILFDADKSTIRSGAEKDINDIATSIKKRYANKKIRIYGFTDSTGSKNYNQKLSEERAAAVQSALAKDGIDSTNISLEPFGEAKPVASNKTEEGRQENRRVEIVVSRS